MSEAENVPLAEMFAGLLAVISHVFGMLNGMEVLALSGLYVVGVLACVRSYTRVLAQ